MELWGGGISIADWTITVSRHGQSETKREGGVSSHLGRPVRSRGSTLGRHLEEAKDFVEHLLERDPKKRPTARAALLHPWLQTNEAQWKSKQRRQVSGGIALGGQVVARLQRFSTQGLLKRSVLRLLDG